MRNLFESALMWLALAGLGVSLAALAARVGAVRSAARRTLAAWRGMTALGRFVICSFVVIAADASVKTNNILRLPNLPRILRVGEIGERLGGRPVRTAGQVSAAGRSMAGYAAWKTAKWNVRGAWRDSLWLAFGDGWTFPHGTNHLAGVEVLAQGGVRPKLSDTNAVASVGAELEIVRGISSFAYELTPSNSYRLVWTDCAVERDTDNLISAAIELFRNGDVAIETNGVVSLVPREFPFAHDGFGQDAEWVAANCTNAAEIAAAGGYAAWVDAQVGAGLANGLFKLAVTLAADPPETTLLVVGDSSVAVTNAGEYVFLLEKGREYSFGTIPFAQGVSYEAVDDLEDGSQVSVLPEADFEPGVWRPDGGLAMTEQSGEALGRLIWFPLLRGWPDVARIGPGSDPLTFTAVIEDYRDTSAVTFEWGATDGLSFASPHSQTTQVVLENIPSWALADLHVSAAIGGWTLRSTLYGAVYGTNDVPQVHLALNVPSLLLCRDEWMPGSESAVAHVSFHSDIPTNGFLRVWSENGSGRVETNPAMPISMEIIDASSMDISFATDGVSISGSVGDVDIHCAFEDATGTTNITRTTTLTVISPDRVAIPPAPDTGLCILKNSTVSPILHVEPNVQVETHWQTAKRYRRDLYDSWQVRRAGLPNASFTMDEAGVFALRAVAVCGGGCQSNCVEYVHQVSEPYVEAIAERQGPNKAGERDHIGVAATQRLLDIRNAALAHLGVAEYRVQDRIPANDVFSSVPADRFKCNRFVADVVFEAGYAVPAIHVVSHTWPVPNGLYPPIANEWANGDVEIDGWTYLGRDVYPEPGFIAGRPAQTTGHCGIVDYDGWTISARSDGIGRKSESMLDGTCGYNRPTETNQ